MFMMTANMRPNGLVLSLLAFYLRQCAADLCNWSGSGLAREAPSRTVQQVRLRCTAGRVRWLYPSQALRVLLQPNLSSSSSSARHTAVCIKPLPNFRGASVYVERGAGELDLLMADDEHGQPEQVFCFRVEEGAQKAAAIFLQASPQSDDVSRRSAGFRYELLETRSAARDLGRGVLQAACRPCNDSELLLAVCSSDFVVRGSIRSVSHNAERQTSLVEVSEGRVYRQRSGVFEREAVTMGTPKPGSSSWHGRVHTLRRCGARPGPGVFLFTGAERFGEAWLGCAPRYRDFLALYQEARRARRNPCDFPLD